LLLLEHAAEDPRNFVKKSVSWALRAIGRRSPKLSAAAVALAQRLVASTHASARWVGRDALKDLTGSAAARKLQAPKASVKGPRKPSAGSRNKVTG
jgi:hypothetical protein